MVRFLSRLTVHERASEAMVGLLVALAARGSAVISTQHEAEATTLALISLIEVAVAYFALMGLLTTVQRFGAGLRGFGPDGRVR